MKERVNSPPKKNRIDQCFIFLCESKDLLLTSQYEPMRRRRLLVLVLGLWLC